MSGTHEERLARARLSLEGLSVGDALGGFFEFGTPTLVKKQIKTRSLPSIEHHYTDDTNMALSIYEILRLYQAIHQDELAMSFALHFDKGRGYGPSIRGWVPRVLSGQGWQEAARRSFAGTGSFGNGGAMRVAPIGAYWADDLNVVVEQARLSCEITHAHPEGIAGAIAIAVAAATAWQLRGQAVSRTLFLTTILPYIPTGDVYTGVEKAILLEADADLDKAVKILGNGSKVTAQDTVPLVLWCVGEKLDNYEEAIWLTASAAGDVDTTCAMVGGIVAMYTGTEGIPANWIAAREALPNWALGE